MNAADHFLRITRLAADRRVHAAFRVMHLGERELIRTQCELSSLPAPPFGEAERATAVATRLRALGYTDVTMDAAGNVLCPLAAERPGAPVLLVSAHLDTIFPAGTDTQVRHDLTTGVLHGPGIADNGAGLAALLALAAALRAAEIQPAVTVLLAANCGEEGPGNLRGMRELFVDGPWAGRIGAALALEGAGDATAVDRALGSRRFRVEVSGPGGHSWADAGTPNPVVALAAAITALAALPRLQHGARTSTGQRATLNVGIIGGGTAVNAIPQHAAAELDLRATSAAALQELEQEVRATLAAALMRFPALALNVQLTGDRPAAELAPNASLLGTLRAVDRHLQLSTDLRIGSTDANLPLSLGIPALALGCGGVAGGIHTPGEWYAPAGREVALRRLLLLLLAAAEDLAV